MKKPAIMITVMVLALLGLILFSCSGSGTSGSLAQSGSIALYLTDDMSLYSQVTATINAVRLRNTGTGQSCDVLTGPVSANLANLAAVLQFVNETACPAGPYNRIRIDFDRDVQVMSGPTGSLNTCSFESYRSDSGSQPNVLQCDQDNVCSLEVNGAINVAVEGGKMGLDFDLKNFDVAYQGAACSVTLKVSPVTPDQMQNHIRHEVVTGLVTRLSTTNRTFDLVRGSRTFRVLYSAVSTTEQPGIDALLQRAQDDSLRTKVFSQAMDLTNSSITATAVIVKVEGTLSDLASGTSFTVHYAGTKTMPVDHSRALIEGTAVEGAWADVKLFGWNQQSGLFLADSVEVELQGTMTED